MPGTEKSLTGSTPDREQSETLLTIDEGVSKIARNSDFDCHLSPLGRQMAIKNSVSNKFGRRQYGEESFNYYYTSCNDIGLSFFLLESWRPYIHPYFLISSNLSGPSFGISSIAWK